MYLSDTQIKEKLKELNIVCSNAEEPFNPGEQIQPCSIDLRLDNIFWISKKKSSIDLRTSKLLELSPSRYWKKIVLSQGEYITLKPGELINARVYEKFTIPSDCAGKIEGRSSFARIGLGVHISKDFINPGYRGNMPLELVIFGTNNIKIYPYLPICQLMLIRLTSIPSRLYGERELQSKYMDDDGAPFYWWRDKRIQRLQLKFQEHDVALRVQEEILGKIGEQEPMIIERFEKFVSQKNVGERENAELVLNRFVKNEEKLKKREKIFRIIGIIIFPIFASTSLGSIFYYPFNGFHYAIWSLTALTIILFIYTLLSESKNYLTEVELTNLERRE